MKIIDNSNYRDEYETKCEWPEDTFVQGGSCGIVTSKRGNYSTAYFEAFPKNPEMFVRGEGSNLEEAEKDAFEKFLKWTSCKEHEFEKLETYKNGMGKCKHCGYMEVVFEPDYTCVVCGSHDNFTGILSKYKKTSSDCICKNCAEKKENFKYLSELRIHDLVRYYNGLYGLSVCICDEETFDSLRTKPNSLEEFFDILKHDSNIYLYEAMKRMLEERDEDGLRFPNLCKKVNNYDELYDYFYLNYMKKWIDKGFYKKKGRRS